MDANNNPLNKAAWKWLREAKQPTDQHALYLLDLAWWGLHHGAEGDWPERDRPALEQQIGLMFKWKPENAVNFLLSNPNGPDKAEQESGLLQALRGASNPKNAAALVLNNLYGA